METGDMQIRLLGSVEVERSGQAVKLAGPKQRAVLAMLALGANAPVSLERLIDGLWGEDPPATGAKMVQQYVSQLRRLLSGEAEIVTRGRGYELRIGADAVDALRFERLVEESASDALALWGGPPLAGMEGEPFAAAEARRLEELHLTATEHELEAELQAGRHAEAIARLGALVEAHPLRERMRALLMLALYRAGRQAEALDAFRDARWTLVETLGLEPGPELRRLQEAILRQDPTLDVVVPDVAWASRETVLQVGAGAGRASQRRQELRAIAHELAENVIDLRRLRAQRGDRRVSGCPFRGLEPFDVGDADLFFGRERLVAELVARLPGQSLLGVVGPSGAGKSSVVRAGLLPALAAGALPESQRWTRVVLRPGEQPLRALRRALNESGRDPIAAALQLVPAGLRLLVVVDQFEEAFTACRDSAERSAFLRALAADDARLLAVLVLRADFYGACSEHARLARMLGESHALVGPMRADEVVRAIEAPAAAAGLALEPELTARLVEETAGQSGSLPLLSTTLVELWRQRSGDRLTLSAYERTGGVRGAVARLAETAYERLAPVERDAARHALLRLAGTSEASVSRRVSLTEFDLDRNVPARRALDVLTEHRLLTVGDDTVEVAHEALLREWPRLCDWLQQDVEARGQHQRLTRAAGEWDAGGRDAGELYRGARLAAALDFAAEHGDALNALEHAFLDEARLVSEHEARRSRRTNRRLRALLAGALVALIAACAAGLVALEQRGAARHAATVADAQRLGSQALTDDRLDHALLLARTGVELDDSVTTRGNLLATLLRVQPGSLGVLPDVRDVEIYAVAISPHGDRLALGDASGDVQVFDLHARRQLAGYRLPSGLVQRIAYSPDGSTLAVTSLDTATRRTQLELRDARSLREGLRVVLPALPEPTEFVGASPVFTGRDLVVLQSPFPNRQPQALLRIDGRTGAIAGRSFRVSGSALDPVVSRDHRRVLVAGDDATYELDARDLRVIARHPAGGVALALHPDDRTLALAGVDGRISLLDLRSSRARALAGRHREVTQMVFTPDGETLLSIGAGGKLTVWDAFAGTVRERLDAHAGSAEAVAVTPDGPTAVSAGVDGQVALWDVGHGRRPVDRISLGRPFAGGDATSRGIAVSPDDRTLAVTHSDGGVDLIDTATLQRRAALRTGPGAALALDYSPDGRLLAVAGEDGKVGLWDARTLAPAGRLAGLHARVQAIAFSPNGRLLAASEVNTPVPRIRVWDVRRRALTPFRDDSAANSLAFSPDGSMLAAAGSEAGTEILAARSGRLIARLQTGELARSVAFSPDGRLLFVGLSDGAWQFYSTRGWRPVGARVRGQGQRLLSPMFTPDGRTLATASADGTLELWHVATRTPIGSPFTVEPGASVASAISHSGAYLYAAPTGTSGLRLELSPASWKRKACLIAGRALTQREWREALPGRQYRSVCPRP